MSDKNISGSATALSVGLGMGAVWFATHAGAGFATGNQEVNFYVKYGWYAIFLPIISMLILGWAHRNALVIAKDNNAHDYKSYTNALFHPYEKILGPIADLLFIGFLITGVCASIAGAASLLQKWGLPYGIGLIIVGATLAILTTYGGDLVIRVLKYKAYFLIVSLALVTILGIKAGLPNIQQLVAAKATFGAGFGTALWNMIVYAGFQSVTAFAIVSISHNIKTTRQCNAFMLSGTLLNGLFLAAVTIMLFGFAPGILKQTLPVYTVATSLGIPWLQVLYTLILFVALIGTGVGVVYSSVAFFQNLKLWDKLGSNFENMRVRRVCSSVFTIIVCTGISVVGLTTVIVKGYGTLGKVAIFLLLIPEIVVGTIKIRNAAQRRKEQGIDEESIAA